MWRKMIALGLVCMVGTASAEQTLDEAMQNMAVFDCEAEGQTALYVFRTGVNGETSLLDDPTVPVRREGGKYSVITTQGAREISSEAYFVYQNGAAISGSCYDATSTAQAIFPTLMDGFLLSSPKGIAEAEAAAILVQDMQVKSDIEVAQITAESELAQAALAAELDATKEQLATVQAELDAANEQIPALFESSEALSKSLEEKDLELATLSKLVDKSVLELATEREENAALREKISGIEGNLAETNVAMAQLEAVSTLKDAALERAMARIEETDTQVETLRAELEAVTQERRALAANVASLNQRTSDLAGQLGRAETDLEAATKAIEEAKATAVASTNGVGSLTDAAISRIATLQNRGISDVQAELCSTISSASRPARCGN